MVELAEWGDLEESHTVSFLSVWYLGVNTLILDLNLIKEIKCIVFYTYESRAQHSCTLSQSLAPSPLF